MRAGRASLTAQMVAFWRALADKGFTSVPGFSDPVARRMLGRTGTWLLTRTEARLSQMTPEQRAGSVASIEAVTLRVATIDGELVRAVEAGARQVVILGAGFDTRAYRMPALAESVVFEVDHPATQAVKATRIDRVPTTAKEVRRVPVDFERDSLPVALLSAGHLPDQPTVWISEGVVMYLGDEALRGTLTTVRERSAPGSTLILHYHLPSASGGERIARRVVFAVLGERQIGLRSVEVMHGEVERAGFAIERDTDAVEQAATLHATAPAGDLARVSRILVGRPA